MKTTVLHRGKWLSLMEKRYPHHLDGRELTWEYATRNGAQRAVTIIATTPENRLVVIKQFRAPLEADIIELPAGLIDEGEPVEETAVRELREETGFIGVVLETGPFVHNSPGISDESVAYARMRTTARGEPSPDLHERIETMELPLDNLRAELDRLAASGLAVSAKLYFLALGLAAV